jgi:hypothetical protein
MIDVKEAVKIAKSHIAELYSDAELTDLLLEEVEISEDEKYWFITLGFYMPKFNPNKTNSLAELSKAIGGEQKYIYKYKVFKINTETGKVLYMKMDKDGKRDESA